MDNNDRIGTPIPNAIGKTFWAAVPIRVWEYTLGGYQMLKKWLSYRELPLLGRPLHEDEARYFARSSAASPLSS